MSKMSVFLGVSNVNRRGVCLRKVALLLIPIVSVCCLQVWAVEADPFDLKNLGDPITIYEGGTYTASDSLTRTYLRVEASPVTFDFLTTPENKVFLTDDKAAFAVCFRKGKVSFKGGEFDGNGTGLFTCGYNYSLVDVVLSGCVWTNVLNVIIGRDATECSLTLDDGSRVYATECRLAHGGEGRSKLNILGGSGLFLSSNNTPFRTDTNSNGGSGTITVAGEGSIFSAPKSEFRIYHAPDHTLIVSNKASLVANDLYVGKSSTAERARVLVADGASVTAANIYMHSIGGNMTVSNNSEVSIGNALDIGRDDVSDAVGASVLVADGSTLTAKEITIRNPGCGLVVSNATLVVDSTKNDAIKVGYAGRLGGSFVLSGEDAQIDYPPSGNVEGNVEVFAVDGSGAEFRLENGATWEVGANQIAGKTSNSVFRIESGATFRSTTRLQFGPAGDNYADPASSLSNRLEVCDSGNLDVADLRFSGHGSMLIVSNGLFSCGQIQLGYNRPYWKTTSKVSSRDCAIVLRGEEGRIESISAVQVSNGSILRFEVPESGYSAGVVPLKATSLIMDEGTKLEIDCAAFAETGGKFTLVELSEKMDNAKIFLLTNAIESVLLPRGSTLRLVDNYKKLVLRCPRKGMVLSVR